MKQLLIILFFVKFNLLFAQSDSVFKIINLRQVQLYGASNIEPPGIVLNKYWRFHKGDSVNWAKAIWNDRKWEFVDSDLSLLTTSEKTFKDCGWFRIHVEIDTLLVNKPLVMLVSQMGASEIYLDGKLLKSYGKMDSKSIQNDTNFNPHNSPINICFENQKRHLIAVRYHNNKRLSDAQNGYNNSSGFTMRISEVETVFPFYYDNYFNYRASFIFYFTFFFALGILHFFFFLFYKTNKSNLFYSIFTLSFGLYFLFQIIETTANNPDSIRTTLLLNILNSYIYPIALLAMLYTIFYNKIPKLFWVWFTLKIIELIGYYFHLNFQIIALLNLIILIVEPIRIIIAAIIKKKEGAWIIGSGVITTIVFLVVFAFIITNGKSDIVFSQNGFLGFLVIFTIMFCTISIPLSMSVFLAREFAKINKNLQKKLIEVEDLSYKSIEQEKEKQQILANQNVILENQVEERTHEITEQKKIIEEKNKDITDSISYAKRIQNATLPPKELKNKLFPQAFVLFKPKDIVSGDFYWFAEINGNKFIAAADCTGHGVPGAMVSVVCSNALNRAIKEYDLTEPGKILDKVREIVVETFSKSESNLVNDGMDISFCTIMAQEKSETKTVLWAGANNPLWYIQNNELKEITANKQPVGICDNPLPYTTHIIHCKTNDALYLFSDGYADQFGGLKGKKLKYKQFSEFVLSIQNMTMPEQEIFLDEKFESWKGDMEQVDDVLVIGVRI